MPPAHRADLADSGAPENTARLHGTCIAIDGKAVMFRGPSASGKSDLALRCLKFLPTFGMMTSLVSDDQVLASQNNDVIMVRPPETIAGKLEVRGIGIVEMDYCANARLCLVLDLVDLDQVDRLPDLSQSEQLLGVSIPTLRLTPWEPSAPIKVALALQQINLPIE